MKISGGTTFGNCATGSSTIVTAPTMTVMIEITMATMGRLIKNLDVHGLWRGIGRVHRDAILHFLDSFDNDSLAEREAFLDYPKCPDALANLHWLDVHLVVRLDHGD